MYKPLGQARGTSGYIRGGPCSVLLFARVLFTDLYLLPSRAALYAYIVSKPALDMYLTVVHVCALLCFLLLLDCACRMRRQIVPALRILSFV